MTYALLFICLVIQYIIVLRLQAHREYAEDRYIEERRARVDAERRSTRAAREVEAANREVRRTHHLIEAREREMIESRERILKTKLEEAEAVSVKLEVDSMGLCWVVPVEAWPNR